jgi:hypothetical protein
LTAHPPTNASLPARLQRRLIAFYNLSAVPPVDAFVSAREDVERERLLVRHSDEGLELTLELPAHAVDPRGPIALDLMCQVLEGVSHFVLVTHRATTEGSTSRLELELQAEVDKFVVLALLGAEPPTPRWRTAVKERLYERVSYDHPAGTEPGDRYRVANRLAMRFVERLERHYLARARVQCARDALRTFYRLGPGDKLAYAAAA